jgi:hypothetical protein
MSGAGSRRGRCPLADHQRMHHPLHVVHAPVRRLDVALEDVVAGLQIHRDVRHHTWRRDARAADELDLREPLGEGAEQHLQRLTLRNSPVAHGLPRAVELHRQVSRVVVDRLAGRQAAQQHHVLFLAAVAEPDGRPATGDQVGCAEGVVHRGHLHHVRHRRRSDSRRRHRRTPWGMRGGLARRQRPDETGCEGEMGWSQVHASSCFSVKRRGDCGQGHRRSVSLNLQNAHHSLVLVVQDVAVEHPLSRMIVVAHDEAHGLSLRHVDRVLPASGTAPARRRGRAPGTGSRAGGTGGPFRRGSPLPRSPSPRAARSRPRAAGPSSGC